MTNVDSCPFASKIRAGLYVGSKESSYNQQRLKLIGVTHILIISSYFQPPFPMDFNYLVVRGYDTYDQDLISHFDECYEFIEKGIGTGVLVHCEAGISRSSTITVAYLMKKNKIDCTKALSIIRKARPIVFPNEGFFLNN